MKQLLILITVAIMSAQVSLSQKSEPIIIDQPDAPLKITFYLAGYQEGGQSTTEGIRHTAEYQNVTERKIVASQVSFVSFNIFNEYLDLTGGIDMSDIEPGDKKRGAWIAHALADFSFHTGIAYISKVRFENGEIWEANLEAITAEMQKVESGFDASRLTPDKDGS